MVVQLKHLTKKYQIKGLVFNLFYHKDRLKNHFKDILSNKTK